MGGSLLPFVLRPTKERYEGVRKTVLLLASMTAALVLAIGVALVVPKEQARAAFPGMNGKIAFLSGHPQAIYTINSDGSALLQITHDPPFIDYPWSSPAWSPDGTRIAYAAISDPGASLIDYDIYTVSAYGGAPTKVTGGTRWADFQPVWSANGKKIAFGRDRVDDGSLSQAAAIYTVNATGGAAPTKLATKNTVGDHSPAWSPDGTKIAYAGVKPGESGASIYVVSARGGMATKLTSKMVAYEPTWSPDSKKIAYTAAYDLNTQTDILAKSITGGTPPRVTNTKMIWESEPTWSPSGTRIAYIYDAPNNQTYPHGIRAIAATGEGVAYRIIPTADYPGLTSSAPDWGVALAAPPS